LFSGRYLEKIIFVLLPLAVLPYMYLSLFANPAADDYYDIIFRMHADFLQASCNQYMEWSGRYFLNVLIWLNPLSYHNFFIYKLTPVLIILFSLVSIYYFIRALTKRIFSPLISLSAALLLLLLYLFQMPVLAQGIYWYSGSATYQTGIICSLLYFGLMADYFFEKYFFHKNVHLLLACLILLISTGFNEVMSLLLMFFHFSVLLLLLANKKKIPKGLLATTIVCLAGLLIMLLAPGNSVRRSFYPEHHNFFHSLFFTFLQIIRFTFDWITNLPFILSSLLLLVIVVMNKERFSFLRRLNLITPGVAAYFLAGILFLCIFPAYWETNILGQQRTVNVAYFFFLIAWFIFILVYSVSHSEYLVPLVIQIREFTMPAVLVVVLSICFTKNGYTVCTDLLYAKAMLFDREMNDRYEVLENSGNRQKTVVVRPLQIKPVSLYVLDLEDSSSWVNYCQAKYFGVTTIVCK